MTPPDELLFVGVRPARMLDGMLDLADPTMLVYVLPTLGPTSTVLLHRVALQASLCTMNSARFNCADLAQSLGVPVSMLRRSIARLVTFSMLCPSVYIERCWDVPTHITLPSRWLEQVPLSALKG